MRVKQHRAKLVERLGRIVKYSQQCLAILQREGNEILFGVERQQEHIGGVLEPGSEQELSQEGSVAVGDGHTCESHVGDATRITGYTMSFNVLCECSSAGCALRISITPAECESIHVDATQFIVVAGHANPGIEDIVGGMTRYDIVRKRGDAAAVARQADES